MKDYTEIDSCRICGNTQLDTILDLGLHTSAGRFPRPNEPDPMASPLVLVKCHDETNNACGLVQLKHSVRGDELYQHEYGYFSGINKTMVSHLEGIVHEIERRTILQPGDVVVDIGSNDGTLLKFYNTNLQRIGIDPTGEQFKKFYPLDIKLISSFFNSDAFSKASDKKAKVITSIACFYDLPEPNAFVKDIRDSLDPEGIWVFEQSYMPTMLKTKSIDTVCNEHVEFYHLKPIKYLLDRHNMKIIGLNFNDTNGGSFRITAAHSTSSHKPCSLMVDKYLRTEQRIGLNTLEPYKEFKIECEAMRHRLMTFLRKEKAKGKSIYILGASTKGNTLLQYCGIGKDLITAAAERNPEKFGRRTPGTNIPIISEDEARAAKPDYFLVLPWHFAQEIIKRESTYLDGGGKLIIPLPTLYVECKDKHKIKQPTHGAY